MVSCMGTNRLRFIDAFGKGLDTFGILEYLTNEFSPNKLEQFFSWRGRITPILLRELITQAATPLEIPSGLTAADWAVQTQRLTAIFWR